MRDLNKIPIINDKPTPKELDAMYKDLMEQKDDMENSRSLVNNTQNTNAVAV